MNEWIGHESILTMAPPPKSEESPELEPGSTEDAPEDA